jgi:hypothetical protein
MSQPDFTVTADMARELAASARVCGRPMLRRVHDRAAGSEEVVPIPCGSTREAVCPACARKARLIRIQQCTEGWHLTDEPDRPHRVADDEEDQLDKDQVDEEDESAGKRVRSTCRRQNMPDLPRLTMDDRTVGQVFTAEGSGKQYRPSMFASLTRPSYGAVLANGAPKNPAHYDYRRAALDALHFSKLCGRFWTHLRRCAGYNVQYFSVIEAQKRLAPHLHAAIRGALPRAIFRQVVAATDFALWWPSFDQPVYLDRVPVWTGPEHGYADPDTGEVLPTWDEALDRIDTDPDAKPAHVMRFGKQLDLQGVIPEHADQAVRYLAKYLTKAIGETHTDPDSLDQAYKRHLDRLHAELRWLPCSPRCANWLRYGVQPDHAAPGLIPGQCRMKAHDRDNLGVTRRVLPSRLWSGKTVDQHKADRAQVVRETLLAAGIDAPDLDRMAASVTLADGSPRFVWTDVRPDHNTYVKIILDSISERQRWRTQYEHAKAATTDDAPAKVSTVAQPP